ncbi:protein ARABIDOPSIS THALIANA ANTHER 7-like [Salvia hispanica]|uniref:protein ARABIDOPSIS THALIANA ANTHER 7-like n=1 Tax=Salvia hispanica TaxID=49212 RepID=UPI0020091798|nr:protein ARABIDOPSIS THALIANA ANTHER 7-like [Salvia hispanica]
MKPLILLFALALALTLAMPITASRNKGCRDVFNNFGHCAGYIQGLGNKPSRVCCLSVTNLNSIAKHEPGGSVRICQCIEHFASYRHHPFVGTRIRDLPRKCNTRLSFPISERMDCNRAV